MIGGGLPVYQGYSSQFGFGLGNVLGGVIRSAVPLIAPLAKDVGRKLLLAGAERLQRKIPLKRPSKRKNMKRKTDEAPMKKRRRRDIFK